MGKTILLVLFAIAVVLIAVIALQPSTFAIERATEIAAPADVVFAHLDSPTAMDVWSPFVKMDPAQKITHEGPERGVGATESWEGPKAGAGRLTITNVEPNEAVAMRLDFTKPMHATNQATFTLVPTGDGTHVAWRMEGTNNFVAKAASLVMDMDRMVGGMFESGLAELKTIAETEAKERAEQAAAAQAAESVTLPKAEGFDRDEPGEPLEPATPPAEE
jgi:uncharacterized protein YndB with AHSA1/START domain